MGPDADVRMVLILRADQTVRSARIEIKNPSDRTWKRRPMPPEWKSVADWPTQVLSMMMDELHWQERMIDLFGRIEL